MRVSVYRERGNTIDKALGAGRCAPLIYRVISAQGRTRAYADDKGASEVCAPGVCLRCKLRNSTVWDSSPHTDSICGEEPSWKATAWKTPWDKRPIKLYEDLPKHEATALFLLRTEVLGLNNWLASINVPDFTPACPCGWIRQTVRHILLFCPLYEQGRAEIVRKAASTDMTTILSKPGSGAAAARWLTRSGALPQFRTAVEIALDTTRGEDPTELREWTL